MRGSLLIALFCALLPVLAFADPDVPALMNQAQRAYLAGDYPTATDLFNQVLEADPNNTLATQYLRKIKLADAGVPQDKKKSAIEGVMIPKIEFKQASFSSALDFLKQQAAAQSVAVSFVSELPPAQSQQQITLSLTEIPFLEALKYLCQLDGATYKVEQYAIVITPAPAPGTSEAAASP